MITAAAFGVPDVFNAAGYFIDRHVQQGRGGRVAIECGDDRITYADLHDQVNRFGSLLRDAYDVRPEERIVLPPDVVLLENALIDHPAVHECGVIGREDRDGLTKPAAFVVLTAGIEPTPDLALELQRFVRERLAEYKRPRWVEFLTELPKTATGKIQRYRLREIESGVVRS